MRNHFKVIKNLEQYTDYCNLHEQLTIEGEMENEDTLELLELLIETYDSKLQNSRSNSPVELLRELIEEAWQHQADFAQEIELSAQLVSDILNYRRRISGKTALKLAAFFALKLEAFSVPYDLEAKREFFLAMKRQVISSH